MGLISVLFGDAVYMQKLHRKRDMFSAVLTAQKSYSANIHSIKWDVFTWILVSVAKPALEMGP